MSPKWKPEGPGKRSNFLICAEKSVGRGGSAANQVPLQPGTASALGLRASSDVWPLYRRPICKGRTKDVIPQPCAIISERMTACRPARTRRRTGRLCSTSWAISAQRRWCSNTTATASRCPRRRRRPHSCESDENLRPLASAASGDAKSEQPRNFRFSPGCYVHDFRIVFQRQVLTRHWHCARSNAAPCLSRHRQAARPANT